MDLDLAEILGIEDNPFSLFLILILLMGATGYFDPKSAEAGATSDGQATPTITLPVWQKRPAGSPAHGLIFNTAPSRPQGSPIKALASRKPRRSCFSAPSLRSRKRAAGTPDAPDKPTPKEAIDMLVNKVKGLRAKVSPRVAPPRHASLRVRHKMLQH